MPNDFGQDVGLMPTVMEAHCTVNVSSDRPPCPLWVVVGHSGATKDRAAQHVRNIGRRDLPTEGAYSSGIPEPVARGPRIRKTPNKREHHKSRQPTGGSAQESNKPMGKFIRRRRRGSPTKSSSRNELQDEVAPLLFHKVLVNGVLDSDGGVVELVVEDIHGLNRIDYLPDRLDDGGVVPLAPIPENQRVVMLQAVVDVVGSPLEVWKTEGNPAFGSRRHVYDVSGLSGKVQVSEVVEECSGKCVVWSGGDCG